MRPSRIIVGEVRAEECLDLLLALNAGLPPMLRHATQGCSRWHGPRTRAARRQRLPKHLPRPGGPRRATGAARSRARCCPGRRLCPPNRGRSRRQERPDIPRCQRDHVLVGVKVELSGLAYGPALTPTPGAVPKRRAGCRPDSRSKNLRSLRFQGARAGLPETRREARLHWHRRADGLGATQKAVLESEGRGR